MSYFSRFVSYCIAISLVHSTAFSAPAVDDEKSTPEEIAQVLDQTVAEYNQLGTTNKWLAKYEARGRLTSDEVHFFHDEFAKQNPTLPSIKRVGTDLQVGDSNSATVIKFGNIDNQVIEINKHMISMRGLSAKQIYLKIQDALPKSQTQHFSFFISEAKANILIITAVVAACIATELGIDFYDGHAVRRAFRICENKLTDPKFKALSAPLTETQRDSLTRTARYLNEIKTNYATPGEPNTVQLADCQGRFMAIYNKLILPASSATQPIPQPQ